MPYIPDSKLFCSHLCDSCSRPRKGPLETCDSSGGGGGLFMRDVMDSQNHLSFSDCLLNGVQIPAAGQFITIFLSYMVCKSMGQRSRKDTKVQLPTKRHRTPSFMIETQQSSHHRKGRIFLTGCVKRLD
ncbi:hypothetical protein HJG60_007874 [Phyllostomus discolor]|uniref:Uncharacterized protein n=1 Tax=Phyllostomus discolor TaxID=89673 RepID=A0A834BHM6_9CHIR|nr:hypothetical protein HJG60_007874 [Phyllostomus discolor]